MKIFFRIALSTIFIVNIPTFLTFAQSVNDLSISQNDIFFSQTNVIEGQTILLYATVTNTANKDLLGTVRFYDGKTSNQIDSDQPISVLSQKTDDVFVTWTPTNGSHTIIVVLDPWDSSIDDQNNNSAQVTINVDRDTDRDGIGNQNDSDDDNDGYPDSEDFAPLDKNESVDTDKDGTGDNSDLDDDNDNIPDSQDEVPLDPTETTDSDKDGIGDKADTDDDNDGLSDEKETSLGTNPILADTDSDSINDDRDALPLDPTESSDFDKDGIGDNKDPDDDNDNLNDASDPLDNNHGPVLVLSKVPKKVKINEEFSISALDSYDPDGKIAKIEWIIDKKEVKKGGILKHVFLENGIHTLKIKAIDDKGEIREKSYELKVRKIDTAMLIVSLLIALSLAFGYVFHYTRRRKSQISSHPKTKKSSK
ncbi:thrombospondin type 3 repeat-containing protein [Candidatus Peregrinibacteria bacterium]|nr:thrombospondin type 3 repeat-containing protein [Candidatus Peregrinibacteria bacterium]